MGERDYLDQERNELRQKILIEKANKLEKSQISKDKRFRLLTN